MRLPALQVAFGQPPRAAPPERVRGLIATQQLQSEILIGWVQFALIVSYNFV